MSWTDERISTLKKMWQQGKSASEIAEKLGGITRNAVIGKAHRLGLSGRPSPIKKVVKKAAPVAVPAKKPAAAAPAPKAATPIKPSAVPAKKPAAAPVAASAPKATAPAKQPANMPGKPPEPVILAALANATARKDGKILSILDLNERMCRWPVGDPKDTAFGYCGADGLTGHPYCADHVAIAFQMPARKDKKQHKEIKVTEVPDLEDIEVEVEDEAGEDEAAIDDDLDADDTVAV